MTIPDRRTLSGRLILLADRLDDDDTFGGMIAASELRIAAAYLVMDDLLTGAQPPELAIFIRGSQVMRDMIVAHFDALNMDTEEDQALVVTMQGVVARWGQWLDDLLKVNPYIADPTLVTEP